MKEYTINLFVLIFCTSFSLFGQYTDVINSNRPGTSKSAFSVGTNVVQFESGLYMVKEEHSLLDYEVFGFGADFEVRYGLLFERLEISLDGIYQNDQFTLNNSTFSQKTNRANFKNITLGGKFLIYDPYKNADNKPNLYSWKANHSFQWNDLIPAVAVYAGINFDTEDNPQTAPDLEGSSPKIAIITQHNFVGGWVFVTNFIKDRIGSDASSFEYILTLTHSFHPKWAVFGETHGIKSDFYADNLIRFGGAYLFNKNFQIDVAATFNTKDTPSVFQTAIGASYRLDFHKDKIIDNDTSAEDELERQINRSKSNPPEENDDSDN